MAPPARHSAVEIDIGEPTFALRRHLWRSLATQTLHAALARLVALRARARAPRVPARAAAIVARS